MAGRNFRLASLFLLLILYVVNVQNSKLNVPRVLLPLFTDISTNFTLEATEGGCYRWSTSRHDIIRLIPVDVDVERDCSSRVIVSTISKEQARNTAIVFAEEINTRQMLRCDVIVDTIFSLSVVTTTRELFMDEAPEAFQVDAYDDQGNEFSTLEGVEFTWSITGIGNVQVLRFISFKDSPYETPPTVQAFDDQGKQGHIILLEGVKTGSAKVSVKLPHREYKHIKPNEVQLMVVANLIIIPADAYILKGDEILFRIYQIQDGKLDEINIYTSQYYLEVESDAVASIETNTGSVTGLQEGKTRIVLHDRNIDESDASGVKLPSASLSVVLPAYITASLLPHRNWAVLVSDRHEIVVDVWSSNDHKLHLSKSVEIKTEVGDLFPISQRSNNGSWLVGKGIDAGIAVVEANLLSVTSVKLGRLLIAGNLKSRNEIVIYPRITLQPIEAVFPWDPITKPGYEIELKAYGGDGKFLWTSSNHSIGIVRQTGLVRTLYKGQFEVSAAMTKNHQNRQSAKIYILPAVRLEIIEYVMEAEVGQVIFLHVALYAELEYSKGANKKFVPFTDCQNLGFKIKTSDKNFVHNKTAHTVLIEKSCANVAITSTSVGTSKVTVQYISNGLTLEDTVTIGSFNKLKITHPSPSVVKTIVLAVGTTTQLKMIGGPRPWPGKQNLHVIKTSSASKDVVHAMDVTNSLSLEPDAYIVKVLCRKLGESYVSLTVSNSPAAPNCKTEESVVHVNIICGKPRTLLLEADMKVANALSCPMSKDDKAVVQSYKSVDLDVIVQDDLGRTFLNVSSLKFDWKVSPSDLGTFETNDGVLSKETVDGPIVSWIKSYQTVYPKSHSGSIEVIGTVVGYKQEILRLNAVSAEVPAFVDSNDKLLNAPIITASINLYLVGDTKVTPSFVTIYNHPENTQKVHVHQGSGYYDIELSSTDVCTVNYDEGDREIEIVPLKDGQVEISFIDLCLTSRPATILVNVVSVRAIKLEMPDKVEIGKNIPAILRLYDDSDVLMPVPNMDLLELQSKIEDDIANIKLTLDEDEDKVTYGEIHFVVSGVHLGDSKVEFLTGSGDKLVSSGPYDLQVFPPLRIMPRNATILLGSVLQLTTSGGPQPDSNIEFSAIASSVIKMSNIGSMQGISLGQTKIIARAIGINSMTGQQIIYSVDQVDVHVVPIKGVKISAPLSRFQTGTKVPIWATGLPDRLSPIILGSVSPEFQYDWSISDNSIVKIEGVFESTGIEYGPYDQVAMRLVGVRPGAATLRLRLKVPGAAANSNEQFVVHIAKLELEVFDKFMLLSPRGITGEPILITPHSKIQITTNRDALNQVTYKLHSTSETNTVKNTPIVTISESGLLESLGSIGEAVVLVTSTDEHGLKQTLAVVVLVKPIHYMMMNVFAVWKVLSDGPVSTIPVGVELELKASYHDNTGAIFKGTPGSELHARLNRFDHIRLSPVGDNTTYLVSSRKPGVTILKVWAEGSHKTVDYIKINAQQTYTFKQNHMTTGDIFCLWNPVVTAVAEQSGLWTSSNAEQVNIDANSGVGHVLSTKESSVEVSYSLASSASLRLDVLPVTRIEIKPQGGERILTNALDSDNYVVSVILKNEQDADKSSNVLRTSKCKSNVYPLKSYPFTCHLTFVCPCDPDVDVYSVFFVEPGFDASTGLYSCQISPRFTLNPLISQIKAKVRLHARTENYVQSEPFEITFVAAVHINPTELQIGDTFTTSFTVTGRPDVLADLSVKPSDSAMLQVSKMSQPSQNSAVYQVKLIDYHWKLDELDDPMSVIISSSLSLQQTKVPVRTKLGTGDRINTNMGACRAGSEGGPPITNFFYAYRHTLTIIISLIIIILVTFYVYSNYINPVINLNVTTNPTQNRMSLLNASGMGPTQLSPGGGNRLCNCSCQPNRMHTCMHHRMNGSHNNSDMTTEPIYGDPNSIFQSPELRRNKRFL